MFMYYYISLCGLHFGKSQFSSSDATVSSLSFPSLWLFIDSYIPLFSYKDTSINLKFLHNIPPVYFLFCAHCISAVSAVIYNCARKQRTQFNFPFAASGSRYFPAAPHSIFKSFHLSRDQLAASPVWGH